MGYKSEKKRSKEDKEMKKEKKKDEEGNKWVETDESKKEVMNENHWNE